MQVENQERKLIVFFRLPNEGKVKKRLAAETGDGNAATLYRAMLADLAGNLETYTDILVPMADRPVDSGNSDRKLPKSSILVPPPVAPRPWGENVRLQEGKDLGARMENAFRRVFGRPGLPGGGSVDKAVLIGSDIPHIQRKTVTAAFDILDREDMVLGPAADGGYYLIGFHADAFFRVCCLSPCTPRENAGGFVFPPHRPFSVSTSASTVLFHSIPWGTREVFSLTVERALGLGLSIGEVSEMVDIDTLEDLIRVLKGPEAEGLPRLRAKAHELGVISFKNG